MFAEKERVDITDEKARTQLHFELVAKKTDDIKLSFRGPREQLEQNEDIWSKDSVDVLQDLDTGLCYWELERFVKKEERKLAGDTKELRQAAAAFQKSLQALKKQERFCRQHMRGFEALSNLDDDMMDLYLSSTCVDKIKALWQKKQKAEYQAMKLSFSNTLLVSRIGFAE